MQTECNDCQDLPAMNKYPWRHRLAAGHARRGWNRHSAGSGRERLSSNTHREMRDVITIKSEGNLVSFSVMGEFTLADYKEFEQEVEHEIQFQGGVNLFKGLRDMADYTLDLDWEEIKFTRRTAITFARPR